MAVAWIGNRAAPVERAAEHAAALLGSSRCPVFSLDTDIHGTRAAIALAERVGAAYDHVDGEALARETALFTDRGGMTISPGEARRRADVVVVVGEVPQPHHAFLADVAATVPDLSSSKARQFFLVDAGKLPGLGGARRLAAGKAGLAATLAALRAGLAGRRVSAPVSNFEAFAAAIAGARFPVFVFSGAGADSLALEMLQGLIGDLNRRGRASGLHLPASESGWGSALASTWMTGFALRTGFARGLPEFDPWRLDVARMIASGEADLHLWISAGPPGDSLLFSASANQATGAASGRKESKLSPALHASTAAFLGRKIAALPTIALTKTGKPVAGAAVTFAIGEPGSDHAAVVYSARIGTLASLEARAPSGLASASAIVRQIANHVPAAAALPC